MRQHACRCDRLCYAVEVKYTHCSSSTESAQIRIQAQYIKGSRQRLLYYSELYVINLPKLSAQLYSGHECMESFEQVEQFLGCD